MVKLLSDLSNNLGYIILIAFIVSKFKSFGRIMQRDKYRIRDLITLSIIFGMFGIMGTYSGKNFEGAIANNRIIGVITGGILCGPVVGTTAGAIAGIHRLLIDVNGITSVPCSISTVIAGILSGYIHKKSRNRDNMWFYGFILSMVTETFEMGMILIISKPFLKSLFIVKSIYVPMIATNAFGVMVSILFIQNIFKEKEQIEAEQAKLTFDIANKTLPYFRELNNNSLDRICEIIKQYIKADAVAITDKKHILAHVGAGNDHHIKGEEILTGATKKVIETGEMQVLTNKSQIECPYESCPLKSAVIVPIKYKDSIIGSFKIYYTKENSITFKNKNLAEGLAKIISTQLEISKVQKLKEMANEAEIRALQSQINPHFLFNVLNTIASLIRIDPKKAREIIIKFSQYLRYNLEADKKFVDINKEIEHIKCYIEIEKARFGDRLNVVYEIDDNINIQIPNFIIEPLVENSVKHGILKGSGNGTVKIEIKKVQESRIKIIVEDDGIGIDEDTIKMVYANKQIPNSIGLSNINSRLKHIYGSGLTIERLKKGTRVSFYIYNKN